MKTDLFFRREIPKLSVMFIDVGSDSDGEGDLDPILEAIYDNRCNRTYSRRGFNKLCSTGLDTESLERHGWKYTPTTGRNSYIYMKNDRVLKISKHHEVRSLYCPHVSTRIEQIKILLSALKHMTPRMDHVKICSFHDEPALAIVMERVGDARLKGRVPTSVIATAAHKMTRHGVFSTDIVTDTIKVNYGNLAFSLTPKRHQLQVYFLDLDATENYVNTQKVPYSRMQALWYKVLCICLHAPVEPISYAEYAFVKSHWTHFFDDVSGV